MKNVISLEAFKQKKQEANEHDKPNNFGDRVSKIKASLEKINTLMSELKSIGKKPTRDSNEEII